MTRHIPIVLVALALTTVALPSAIAMHLSAGGVDTVGTSPDETPNDPSVPGTEPGSQDTPYGIGTSADCYDADAVISEEEVRDAALTHGFCGHLLYNEGTIFEEPSPTDQDIRDPGGSIQIGTFDVQRTYYVGNLGFLGANGCLPMCNDGDGSAQNTTWNTFHTAGQTAGLTEGPEEADANRDGDRFQLYNVRLDLANAGSLAQRNTGAWEANGWSLPYAGESFVGFLEDDSGDPITANELEEHVNDLVSQGKLAPDTTPRVCGYTPDYSYVSTGEQTLCAAPMSYTGPNESAENHGEEPFGSYNDPCQSPAYVCGPTTGAYWDANTICANACYGGSEQVDYVSFHWVVAPNEPDCGVIEPGFDFDGDGAGRPYLAQDLEVFTPVTAVDAGPGLGPDHLVDYGVGLTDDIPDVPAIPDDVADAIDETQETAEQQVDESTEPVLKDDLLEPNHVDADTGQPVDTPIDDDSRLAISEDRVLDLDPCAALVNTETDDTVDPWVSYIDNSVTSSRHLALASAYADVTVDPGTPGLYGEAGEQDRDNDPTTDVYTTDGYTGIFTDKDDDGAYDRIIGYGDSIDGFGQPVYQKDDITETGAYPMLWDMKVTIEDGEPTHAEELGCDFTSGVSITKAMKKAGYGPNTGLAQAIYLGEPTVFTDVEPADPQAVPYAEGNNIYVLGSQAVREIWDGDTDADNGHPLDAEVDTLVDELRALVVEEHGADATSLQVHQPGAELGLDSDYASQCGESTGGYSSQLSFTHTCETGCSGDTVATMYTFELEADGTIGGEEIPTFEVGGQAYEFGTGQHTWHDLDAFDGDPGRDHQRLDPPPTGEE